jgi:hypothetical protein
MIRVFAPLRSRVSALIAQIMVSPLADCWLLLGSSIAAFVLRLLLIGGSNMYARYRMLLFWRANRSRAFAPSPSRLNFRQMLVR